MSQAYTLARPYARAAFSLAHEAGAHADWSAGLAFSARVAADSQVAGLLAHPRLTDADAIALLQPEGAGESFQRFLQVLAENRRLALLPEIAGLYEQLRAEEEHVVRAKVTSAAAMQPAELEGLRAALKKRFGREVEIETAVDEALIGGATIDTGDIVIDGSVRGRLARMQSQLAG